ncbi:MAG: IgGFc-binding protein, partial [Polyangiaceae bacterium]|nr:IgGFc-binding protein [Polyangiaceae bacterium]
LRAFLTIVGTRPNTHVRLRTATRILGTSARGASQALVGQRGLPEVLAGGQLDVELGPFDVLNLETDGFNADFTGSLVEADQPIVVFSGSEASDAPFFQTLSQRRCCADHLEEQLDPVRTAGKRFVATVSPNRTQAVSAAGGDVGPVTQPEYFRVIASTEGGAVVTTTLEDQPIIHLSGRGAYADIESTRHFMLESDHSIMLGSVSPSQDAAGVPRGMPGGDPSFLLVPPVEQFRSNYVFLTPDKYGFDFVRIIAPPGAIVVFDNQALEDIPGCTAAPADGLDARARGTPDPPFVVHTCQLSFPRIRLNDSGDSELDPGTQNDGVHRIESSSPLGVLVDGFDSYVSYAYAAGTELMQIAVE